MHRSARPSAPSCGRASTDNYRTFVQKVADSRRTGLSAQIEPIAQGRVWLGDQAKENGLVDELGGIDRAIELIKQRASIGANPRR